MQALRRNHYTFIHAISKELANIERVQNRQSQFVAVLGSILLSFLIGLSNLMFMAIDRRMAEGDGSL
jgi:hypothetical protein